MSTARISAKQPENLVGPEMPASVPRMVMSTFKGSLEEKPPSSLKGMTVRKLQAGSKLGMPWH